LRELLVAKASGKGRSPRGGDELATRLGVQPAQRVLHVLVRGRLAYPENAGDLAIGRSLCDEVHDLILSRGETRLAIAPRGSNGEARGGLEQRIDDPARERAITAGRGCDRSLERPWREVSRGQSTEPERQSLHAV